MGFLVMGFLAMGFLALGFLAMGFLMMGFLATAFFTFLWIFDCLPARSSFPDSRFDRMTAKERRVMMVPPKVDKSLPSFFAGLFVSFAGTALTFWLPGGSLSLVAPARELPSFLASAGFLSFSFANGALRSFPLFAAALAALASFLRSLGSEN